MIERLFILLVALFILQDVSVAQLLDFESGRPLYVERFGPEDYDRHEQNWMIRQSPTGLIYVANRTGLLEYDGRVWTSYTIPNQFARSIAIDANGVVYVGGVGEFGKLHADSTGGLSYTSLSRLLDSSSREFYDIWTTQIVGDYVVFQSFAAIMIWDGNDLYVIESDTQFHKSFVVNGKYYVREEGVGLKELRGQKLVLVDGGDAFASSRVDAMFAISDGRTLLSIRERGLFAIGSDGHPVRFDTDIDHLLTDLRIYHGISLSSNLMALATFSGSVILLDESGHLVRVLDHSVGIDHDELVLDVFEDHQGGLWLALDTGILRVDAPTPLTVFDVDAGLEGSVYALTRLDGRLTVGTSQGLFQLIPGAGRSEMPRFERIGSERRQVWQVELLGDSVLVASNSGIHISGQDGRSSRMLVDDRAFAVEVSNVNSSVAYVGLKNGIARLRLADGRWIAEPLLDGVSLGEVRSLLEDSKGRLWIGTLSDGVIRVTFEGLEIDSIERFGPDHGLPAGLAMMHATGSSIKVLSIDGVYDVLENGNRIRFARDEALSRLVTVSSDGVYLLSYTDENQVWAIVDGQVRAFERTESGYRDVTPPSLHLGGVPARLYSLEADGVAWIAVEGGIVRHDPRVEKSYGVPYQAHVRSVWVKGDSLIFSGHHSSRFALPAIGYRDNNLRLQVAASTFNASDRTEFQFWLEGFDETWTPWGREAFKEYTNLPEGSYLFHVQARNVHGVISEVATFRFVILPPWYRTWWAYAAYVLGSILLLWSYGRWRLREHVKEMERERRMRESLEVANARLHEANERLHRADKLKDDLLANTSHELRTPLTSILGFASVLHEELDGEHRDFAAHINKSGQRLLNTVNALLDMARLRSDTVDLDPESFSVCDAARRVADRFREDATRGGLFLTVQPESLDVFMRSDRAAVERIISNLVENAVKFTETGGVSVLVDADDDRVHIAVKDTGIGIESDFLPQLFGEFQQASTGYARTYEGNGLGLAITQRLTRLLGGDISVESESGVGTCFRVSLPRNIGPAGDGAPGHIPDARLAAVRVLLVAPAGEASEALRTGLQSLAQLKEVKSIGEARDAWREASFDLTIIQDPERDRDAGELLAELMSPGVAVASPAILATSVTLPGDRERYLAMGFAEHIAMPVSREWLAVTLNVALKAKALA